MAKFTSPTALKLIQQNTGTLPFIVVQINWGGGISYYSTLEQKGMNANIMEIGSIRMEKRADSYCTVGSVNLKLSDTDGAMKFVIDRIAAENWPAAVYLAFEGTEQNDWIELIHGRTVAPILWNETDRTLELGIETVVQSHEIGYAASISDFKDLTPTAMGVPWPMIFGKCCHVPCVLVKKHAEAYLQCMLRFHMDVIYRLTNNNDDLVLLGNPTTNAYVETATEPNVLYVDNADQFPQNTVISILIDDIVFVGKFTSNIKFVISEANAPKYINLKKFVQGPAGDADVTNLSVAWLDPSDLRNNVLPSLANHHCYFKTGGLVEWENYCVRQEENKCWFRFPFRNPKEPFGPIARAGLVISEVYAISKCGIKDDIATDAILMKSACNYRKRDGGTNNFGAIRSHFDKVASDGSSWWSSTMDSKVTLWNQEDPDIYIASLSPLVQADPHSPTVKGVWGKRKVTIDGKARTIFSQVPKSYYRVVTGLYPVDKMISTAILFDVPLKSYAGQDWEDEIFVTAQGSIGPNPVDIIQWALTNFTDLFCDPVSFKIVKGQVQPLANFALFDKRDAFKFCQDIAFQAKCGMVLDSGGVGLVYLPVEPSQQWNFDQSSTKLLRLNFTERKDIITKYVATYSLTYKDNHHISAMHQINIREFERLVRSVLQTDVRNRSETQMYVYTNNINTFGLHTKEEAFYIYNDYAPVKSAADFWGFRYSNCWRMVEFDTWLQGVRLQPFDGVAMNYTDETLLNTTLVMGVVDSVEYNPATYTTRLRILLPIRAGSILIESLFWPG